MEQRDKKKGQLEISFGMIFSIILIIFFLAAAFYGIKTFLSFSDSAKAGQFFTDLQSDVTTIWQSQFSSGQHNYTVPSGISLVCIADFNSTARGSNSGLFISLKEAYTGTENLFLYPFKNNNFDAKQINYLNMQAITENENPYCIKTGNGQVSMIISKDYGQNLVTVERT